MKTIANRRIEEMKAQGYKLAGRTSGQYTYRAGSNLARKLEELGLTKETCEVRYAARAGKNASEGYQLLVFVKA